MSFNFTVKEFILGSGTGTHTLQFYKRGFELNGGGESPSWQDIILSGTTALTLTNALADGLNYLKLFGGTEQRNIPAKYTQVNYVTNTAQTRVNTGLQFDFSKNYEIEYRGRAVLGSWYVLQARESSSSNISGISGSNGNGNIILAFNGGQAATTSLGRGGARADHIWYIKGTINNGSLTLYVKDETSNEEETVTSAYSVSTPALSATIGLLGNLTESTTPQLVGINNDVYMARIKENGVMIMDYVPARQSATAGFYDNVSGIFKTAETPENLTADGNTVPTPDAPMDIVCNNGVLKLNTSATGYSTQTGTPTPTNPIDIVSYKQGDLILRGVDEYKDIYDATTGTITRNIGVKVLNGTEEIYDGSAGYWGIASTYFPNIKMRTSDALLATHWTEGAYVSPTGAYCSISGLLYFAFNKASLPNASTTTDVQQWLADQYAAGTPVIVYYPLATPTTEHYVGVYADGLVETINARGKNLWDGKMYFGRLNQGRPYVTNYTEITSPFTSTGAYSGVGLVVKVVPGQQYCFSSDVTNVEFQYVGFYANMEDVTDYTKVISFANATTGTAPAGANYAVFCWANAALGTEFSWTWAQAEYGSTATDYEPYYDGGTVTCENLLSVGDYTDVQEIPSGDITRKVGVKVFDGTETVTLSENAFRVPLTQQMATNETALSNQYSYNAQSTIANLPNYSMKSHPNGGSIYFKNTNYSTEDQFKAYLAAQYAAGTPVIIVYPLATETTESVTGQALTIQAGTNIVEITQASIDNLGLEVSYKAIV